MQNKPLSPEEFCNAAETQLNNQPKLLQGKDAAVLAKARANHYANGANFLKQVSDTLQQLAASQSDPSSKQRVNLALNNLSEAQNAFGMACLCQGSIWNKDDA